MDQFRESDQQRLDIAVVGSGIAGMSAAWLLSQAQNVTVFEREPRLGGHSNTVEVVQNGQKFSVDTGFIVYNEFNYPNLTELFRYLKVDTSESDMSFAVSLESGSFEFGSRNLNSIFGQRSNVLRTKFWRIIKDIRRFCKNSEKFLTCNIEKDKLELREFLSQGEYSEEFVSYFILPMGAAIWSTKVNEMFEQPALTFLRFFESHGLMRLTNRIPWRTVVGGSKNYIEKLTANYSDKLRLAQGVRWVKRHNKSVEICDVAGKISKFDKLIFATHADQALSLLSDSDPLEKSLLGAFRYTNNLILLHSDKKLMPKRQQVWSSWNFLGSSESGVNVTYWMNSLQSIDKQFPIFVSVNPHITPNQSLTHNTIDYRHPLFDYSAWQAQKRLWQLQNHRNTWYCGSYFGYGFHEDALQSGLAVAEELGGIQRPWKLKNDSDRIYRSIAKQDIAA